MDDILSIQDPVAFNESISHYEIHTHQHYTALSLNNSDEIHISIQHQNSCLLPSRSALHICGRINGTNGTNLTNTGLINVICYLFEEIRYEINAVEFDRCRNIGLTSLMKGWVFLNPNNCIENAVWLDLEETEKNLTDNNDYFDVFIPLNMILGLTEDYNKIVVHVKHELILKRMSNNLNAVLQSLKNVGINDIYHSSSN